MSWSRRAQAGTGPGRFARPYVAASGAGGVSGPEYVDGGEGGYGGEGDGEHGLGQVDGGGSGGSRRKNPGRCERRSGLPPHLPGAGVRVEGGQGRGRDDDQAGGGGLGGGEAEQVDQRGHRQDTAAAEGAERQADDGACGQGRPEP